MLWTKVHPRVVIFLVKEVSHSSNWNGSNWLALQIDTKLGKENLAVQSNWNRIFINLAEMFLVKFLAKVISVILPLNDVPVSDYS